MPAPGPTIARLASLAGGGDADALESLAARVQRTLEAHAQRALASQGRLAPGADDVAEEVVAEVQAFLAGAGGAPASGRAAALSTAGCTASCGTRCGGASATSGAGSGSSSRRRPRGKAS